eukprot:15162083-Alexandrium_andersonii.AAC.1
MNGSEIRGWLRKLGPGSGGSENERFQKLGAVHELCTQTGPYYELLERQKSGPGSAPTSDAP